MIHAPCLWRLAEVDRVLLWWHLFQRRIARIRSDADLEHIDPPPREQPHLAIRIPDRQAELLILFLVVIRIYIDATRAERPVRLTMILIPLYLYRYVPYGAIPSPSLRI